MSTDPARGPASRAYAGWQQDKVAFLFGLSGQRAAMIAGAVLAAIWPIAVARPAEGALTWPAAAVLAAAAFVRVGGRSADEWLAAALSYGFLRLRGQHTFASAAFAPPSRSRPSGPRPVDLPGILAPVRILAAPAGHGAAMGIAHHRLDRTCTAVARIRFPGIGLADSGRRDLRVAGWGALLAGLCTEGSPMIRVQALQRIVPESGAALRRWHDDHLAAGAPPAAVEVTSSLLATSTLATSRREAYLAFVMDERRAAAAIRGAGGGTAGAATVLARQLRALSSAIGTAELAVEGWLGPRDLAEVIRTALTRTRSGRSPSAAPPPPGQAASSLPGWPRAWILPWPVLPGRRPGRAATCTTGRCRRRTGCMTGRGPRCMPPRWRRCWGRARTGGRSRCTSSRWGRGPRSGR